MRSPCRPELSGAELNSGDWPAGRRGVGCAERAGRRCGAFLVVWAKKTSLAAAKASAWAAGSSLFAVESRVCGGVFLNALGFGNWSEAKAFGGLLQLDAASAACRKPNDSTDAIEPACAMQHAYAGAQRSQIVAMRRSATYCVSLEVDTGIGTGTAVMASDPRLQRRGACTTRRRCAAYSICIYFTKADLLLLKHFKNCRYISLLKRRGSLLCLLALQAASRTEHGNYTVARRSSARRRASSTSSRFARPCSPALSAAYSFDLEFQSSIYFAA